MKNQTEICGDGALLLWYVAGALEMEESDRVAQHVEDCHRCELLVRENEELARLYLSLPRPETRHLPSDDLLRLAEGGAGSSGLAEAREHLGECEECRQIVDTVQRVHRELESPGVWQRWGERVERLLSHWTALLKDLPTWLSGPLPAYLVALLLVYPAYLGIGALGQRGRELERPSLLSAPVPIASEAARGPGENRLRLSAADRHTVLTFFVPIATEQYRYQIELKDQVGRTLFFERNARSFDGLGTFALTLPKGSLAPGDYELRIEERGRDDDEMVNVFLFPFTIGSP